MADAPEQSYMSTSGGTGYERQEATAEVHESTFWLLMTPLMCGGFGVTWPTDPLCSGDSKCLCLENHFWTESVGSQGYGCCFELRKVCCVVSHFAFPPGGGEHDGVPTLACCNIRRGGNEAATGLLNHKKAQIMSDAFLLFYLGCCGLGVVNPFDPIWMSSSKCLCLRSEANTGDVFSDQKSCLFSHNKFCCLVETCTVPCVGGSPAYNMKAWKCGDHVAVSEAQCEALAAFLGLNYRGRLPFESFPQPIKDPEKYPGGCFAKWSKNKVFFNPGKEAGEDCRKELRCVCGVNNGAGTVSASE